MGLLNSVETACAVGAVVACSVFAGPFASTAEASLTATLSAYSAGRYEQCGFSSALAWDSTASVDLFSIRAFQHTFTETGGPAQGQFQSWCVEVFQGLDLGGTYTFDVVAAEAAPGAAVAPGPMGAVKAAAVRDLFARWINPATGNVNGAIGDRDAKTSAFQLMLWEISHENFTATTAQGILAQLSLSSGAFRASISGATASWYDSIMQSLGVGGFQSSAIEGLTSATAQDQLRLVPAPGSIALLGLAGLLRTRRRR